MQATKLINVPHVRPSDIDESKFIFKDVTQEKSKNNAAVVWRESKISYLYPYSKVDNGETINYEIAKPCKIMIENLEANGIYRFVDDQTGKVSYAISCELLENSESGKEIIQGFNKTYDCLSKYFFDNYKDFMGITFEKTDQLRSASLDYKDPNAHVKVCNVLGIKNLYKEVSDASPNPRLPIKLATNPNTGKITTKFLAIDGKEISPYFLEKRKFKFAAFISVPKIFIGAQIKSFQARTYEILVTDWDVEESKDSSLSSTAAEYMKSDPQLSAMLEAKRKIMAETYKEDSFDVQTLSKQGNQTISDFGEEGDQPNISVPVFNDNQSNVSLSNISGKKRS